MRTRLLLTGIALGATMLVGGTATAQATPAPSETRTTPAATAAGYQKIGTFSWTVCRDLRDSYAGSAYCDAVGGGKYELWVWVN
ncbi:hypothetical protein ACFU76_21415 [Streptomyces sp. NPDC057539]|uniref:hypothetical protein n=1 Tax=Streptomyces sp. NPDC057539 TaxID=3346159 RepID=UPI003691E3B3